MTYEQIEAILHFIPGRWTIRTNADYLGPEENYEFRFISVFSKDLRNRGTLVKYDNIFDIYTNGFLFKKPVYLCTAAGVNGNTIRVFNRSVLCATTVAPLSPISGHLLLENWL